jgi:hypothetical protein
MTGLCGIGVLQVQIELQYVHAGRTEDTECRPPRSHQGCFEKLVSEPRKPKERAMTLSRDVIDGLPYVEGVLNHASPPIRIEPACGQQ